MQTVLVAGGAGFIGSNLCKFLLDKDYKVICLDNFLTGDRENIQKLSENEHFQILEKNIIDLNIDELPPFEYLFNLASPASPNAKSSRSYIAYPIETLMVNSHGNYHLLEAAKKNNAKFLYASTSEIYGDPTVSPQSEDYFGNVNPNGIRSVYDEAKRFGEAMTSAYVRKYDLDARIVRIFNTYGPNMRPDDGRVISNFICQALKNENITIYGDGTQTRSFCFITDLLDGLYSAMFNDGSKGEVINLGNPDERSILEIAQVIKQETQSSSEIIHEDLPPDDPKERKPDITKAKNLLNWEPKVTLSEGLQKTVEYFKMHNA
jgi:nucleoside-diphosphate-sugar epimerase